jgi:hypothetical protein
MSVTSLVLLYECTIDVASVAPTSVMLIQDWESLHFISVSSKL